MKATTKIMSANLSPTNTDQEYDWIECNEEEYGETWGGDVRGYVENLLDSDGPAAILEDWEGAIHNLPHGAIVIGVDGAPHSIYWAE